MKLAVATVGMIYLLLGAQECAGAAAASMQTARQKSALLQRLLEDSSLSKRVAASGSVEARRLLTQVTDLHTQADKLMAEGEIERADTALNQALGLLNRVGPMSTDASHRNQEQWARHGKLLASVESLQASLLRHIEAEQPGMSEEPWQRELETLLQRARSLVATEQVTEANVALVQAEAVLLGAFKRSYRTSTLDYSPRFRNLQEEFQFELARHGSYLNLVPLAVTELNPPLAAVQAIDRHLSRSRRGREQAERLAAERSFDAAVKMLREATSELQFALTAAGLNVPKEANP